MIIPNGTLEKLITKTGGGLNPETGFPVKGETSWSAPLPAQITPVKQDYRAKDSNGEPARLLSFTVLLDDGGDASTLFRADTVRLTDTRTGKPLGEFSVEAVEELASVCQVRVTV